MRKFASLAVSALCLGALPITAAHSAPAKSPHYLLAHYMPWFEANPTLHKWGWHWTMGHMNPDQMTKGRREIASRYYPLIGPYDSNDPDTLECHVLLMKLAGIDGVLIDWYGMDDYLDYGLNNRNTLHMIQYIKRAGLHYGIVYEEQTVPKLMEGNIITGTDPVPHGKRVLQWMQQQWFSDPAYITLSGKPVFLVFGGGYFKGDQWQQIFSSISTPLTFFTEDNRRPPADGAFAWPNPSAGLEGSRKQTDTFYTEAAHWPTFMPAAYPRFEDFYQQTGGHSWGQIDDQGGKTYVETLERSLKSGAPITQLVTWNDWGEGTIIEPSLEFGYRDLEVTQRLRRKYLDPRFHYTPTDLRLPIALYTLRKQLAGDNVAQARLENASRLLFAGKVDQARAALRALRAERHLPTMAAR